MKKKIVVLVGAILLTIIFLPVIIPKFMRERAVARTNSCINYLSQINGAKQMWAKDNHKNANDVPTWSDLGPYLGTGRGAAVLACPDGGTYTIGKLADAPRCSIPGHYLN